LKSPCRRVRAAAGRVIRESCPDGSSAPFYLTQAFLPFDDGQQRVTRRCWLEDYLNGTCGADAARDRQPAGAKASGGDSMNAYFHENVRDIMGKVKNTGYAHDKNNNFRLIPDYGELAGSHAENIEKGKNKDKDQSPGKGLSRAYDQSDFPIPQPL